jgi:Arc/MetJ family transcription regulator
MERPMASITVKLDANLVIDVMLLTGVRDAQDAVEVVVRDYLARAHRTDAVTGTAADERARSERERRRPEGGS